MNIDICIGNPPYQQETGAGTIITGKKPIYHNFIAQALNKNIRIVCMIIPSRWTNGGIGMENFRNIMELNSNHIKCIVDFMEWNNGIFGSMMIAGGLMYFILDKQYNGKCNYTNISGTNINKEVRKLFWNPAFVRNNILLRVILKVRRFNEQTLDEYCRYNAFGLESYERGDVYGDLTLISSDGKSNIASNKIKQGIDLINKYKIAISGTTPGGGALGKDGKYKVLALVIRLNTLEICTGTYITLGGYNTVYEADAIIKYLKTKFVRSLIQATISSMHIVPLSFIFVPVPDLSKPLTDKYLYEKYDLTTEEIDYIESIIKEMN